MHRKRLKLQSWVFFPIAIIALVIATVIFVFAYKGESSVGGSKQSALASQTPLPTPEPTIVPAKRLFAYKDNGYWGYKSETGAIKIPAIYAKAHEFSDGYAWVVDGTGKYGLIDENAQAISPFLYDDARDFSEGYAAVKQGESWGYVDRNGAVPILPQYSAAWDFKAGYARISKDGKMYYIDTSNNLVSDKASDKAIDFAQTDIGALAVAGTKDAEGAINYYIIKSDGATVSAIGRVEAVEPYVEDTILVRLESGLYTYYETSGHEKILGTFDEARSFSEGLAAVNKEGKWGYILNNSEVTYGIPLQYTDAQSFSEGYAAVKDDLGWYYIRQTGEVLGNASERFEKAEAFSKGYAQILIGSMYYVLDTAGNKVELYAADAVDLQSNYAAKVVTEGGTVNVRKEPNGEAEVLGQLANASEVTVLETVSDWCKIEYREITGYVASRFIFRVEDSVAPSDGTASSSDAPAGSVDPTASDSNVVTSSD